MQSKSIAVLGLTGSIGDSTAEVVRAHREHFRIVIASGHSQYAKLAQLAAEFEIPVLVLTGEKPDHIEFPPATRVFHGESELLRVLETENYDIALNAIGGSAGLRSTIAVLLRGCDLALANKESLVMSGHLVEDILSLSPSRILPVDSEHSAIFQCLGNHPTTSVKNIILTASGGPFRTLPLKDFPGITLQQTLRHPTWDMGAKVTIDAATMMNKGLEVIEAHWLFRIPYDRIRAVIHPQSIIHSMVEFKDGSIIAQMSTPSMQLPILYALAYPERMESTNVQTDLLSIPTLHFEPIETYRYPLFHLACEVGKTGGLMPTIMNAANEAALSLFRSERIRFMDIAPIVEKTVESNQNMSHPDLETIFHTNKDIYQRILNHYK